MIGMGFTVWFDPDGGDDRTLGVQFPLGGGSRGFGMRGMGPGRRAEGGPPDPEEFQQRMSEAIASMDEFVIHGPRKGDRHPRVIDEGKGVEVRIGMEGGGLIYELKVPLARTGVHPYAIGTQPGEAIGVGLETSEFDLEAMRGGMGPGGMGRGGGGIGGVGPGGGMGGGPPGGGRMGGGRPEMPEPLNMWAKVQLATANTSSDSQKDGDVAVTTVE
jgi:hypothetical protein